MIKLYIRREITPPLYGSLNALIGSYKREKTVIRHSVRRQPFSAVLQIMYRTFPIRASADRENTAQLPTERIRQSSDAENGFRLPAALNLSTACHDGVGLGECKKREKERFVFERFFVGTERRKPLFALLLIYTAKNGKT